MTERDAHDLLVRATDDLPVELGRLVAGGLARGRTRRRRRTLGTTLLAAAVVACVGVGGAVLVPGDEPSRSPIATEPTPTATSPTPAPSPTAPVIAGEPELAVAAADFPSVVAGLAGIVDVEGPLMDSPYGVADGPDEWIAHFRLAGALTSVIVERIEPAKAWRLCARAAENCRSLGDVWVGSVLGVPQDGVTANYAMAWVGDLELSVYSYNAAEGKESPVLSGRPQLSAEQLEEIVLDEVWFTPAP